HGQPFFAPPRDPSHLASLIAAEETAAVTGTLAAAPQLDQERTRLLVDVEALHRPTGDQPAHGRLRLSLAGTPGEPLMAGDRVRALARLGPARGFANPGSFDYPRHLARQGIWVSGWIRDPGHLLRLPGAPAARPWQAWAQCLRQPILALVERHAPPRYQALYQAILVGQRAGIPQDLLDNFEACGVFHILSISGAHMAVVALFAAGCARWLLGLWPGLLLRLPARQLAGLFALLPLTGYALVAGLEIPVLRSLIMVVVVLAALVWHRQARLTTSTAAAGLIILVAHPPSLLDVSFQLSFAAMLAIALVLPVILRQLPAITERQAGLRQRLAAWLAGSLALSLAAGLGTAPLGILHFNRLSLVSPVANVLVEPLIGAWALILGLAAALALPVAEPVAGLLVAMGSWGLAAADRMTAWLAALPGAALWLTTPSLAEVAAVYLLLAGILCWRTGRLARGAVAVGLAVAMGVPLAAHLARSRETATRVTVLDVGQGAAVVAELPHGVTVLLDGGSTAGRTFNLGREIIGRFLWQRRIRRLDGMVVSHSHADHTNALPFVLGAFRPRRLWTNGEPSPGGEPEWLAAARQLGLAAETPAAGEVLLATGEARLAVLSSPLAATGSHGPPALPRGPNAASLVVRLAAGRHRLLFPGDIDQEAEAALLAAGADLAAEVLLAPHHGDGKACGQTFLAAVAPKLILASAGFANPFGFPDPALPARAAALGSRFLGTADSGAITVVASGSGLAAWSFRPDRGQPGRSDPAWVLAEDVGKGISAGGDGQ
ncbi:MAG: DNA internalization-related competence protein ComEC/Rec2, partial [Thermodesulfobacteriota bacterium]